MRGRQNTLLMIIAISTVMLVLQMTEADPPKVAKGDPGKIGLYKLELAGVVVGNFIEVEGLESKTEIIQYQQGGQSSSQKVPGKTGYSNIRLRSKSLSADLWQWRKKAIQGAADLRKSGAIIFVAQDGSELARYNFFNAWPAGWKAGKTDNSHMFEEIELAVEGWEKHYP